jgi:predicted DNA-binding transcriptional regulator AlpA
MAYRRPPCYGLGMSPELAGFAEVVEMLKVSRATATKYVKRPDFPEPIERLASGPVWRRADVEAWAKETLPLPTGQAGWRPPRG